MRSKSLDKELMVTLNQMHKEVIKVQKSELTPSNTDFNIKSMSKLNEDNLENKQLKECKINAQLFNKYVKNVKDEKKEFDLPKQQLQLNCKVSSNHKLESKSDINSRRELGDEIINEIDNYLSEYFSFNANLSFIVNIFDVLSYNFKENARENMSSI